MSKVRATSQISVYNYPEHLNPFYEDEQHKRLRFWKIKTSKSSKESKKGDGSLRRGSFNLGSLRDLLPLRSFRSKKNASTLGINQTSESPPQLRRDIIGYNKEDENLYATHDPHFRHTVDGQFQRNAGYRSSLQNMNSTVNSDFLTFNRNNRYRSTLQNGTSTHSVKNGRYVYSGSMTPTPKSRYLTDITPRMTPGSSMNSVSTNPFDDDEEEIEEQMEVTNLSTSEATKVAKPSRKKKRRAPPPPPGQLQMLGAMPSETENVELRTNENERDGLEELSRMTAEFENFVKHTQNEPRILLNGEEMNENSLEKIVEVEKVSEESKLETIQIVEKPDIIQSIETAQNIEKNENCSGVNEGKVEQLEIKETPSVAKVEPNIQIVEIRATEIRPLDEKVQVAKFSTFKSEQMTDMPQLVITEAKILKIDEPPKESSPPIEVITAEVHQLLTEIRSFPDVRHLTPTPTPSREVTPDYIPTTVREKFHVLRIDEDEIETPKPEPRSDVVRDRTPIPLARTEMEDPRPRKVSKTEFLNFDNIENVEIRRKESNGELLITEGDEPQKPTERRRSVKEIIESINREQRKLKINQPPTPQFERKFYYGEQKFSYHEKPAVPSKEHVMLKLKLQEESERKINELLDDLQGYTRDNSLTQKTQKFPLTQRDSNNNNNSFLSSEVNPVPKPRRAV